MRIIKHICSGTAGPQPLWCLFLLKQIINNPFPSSLFPPIWRKKTNWDKQNRFFFPDNFSIRCILLFETEYHKIGSFSIMHDFTQGTTDRNKPTQQTICHLLKLCKGLNGLYWHTVQSNFVHFVLIEAFGNCEGLNLSFKCAPFYAIIWNAALTQLLE